MTSTSRSAPTRPWILSWVIVLSWLSVYHVAGQSDAIPAADDTSTLTATLQSDAPVYEKAMACRQLAVVGDESAVTVIKPLLADPQLATYARTALESIPGEASRAALRESLEVLQGEPLIGVIGTLGRLRDASATEVLGERLSGKDLQVATAAARALGNIGTPEGASKLESFAPSAAPELAEILAWSTLTAAGHLAEAGDEAKAVGFCDQIANATLPLTIRIAAKQQAIRVLQQEGVGRLESLLTAESDAEFEGGLRVTRELGVGHSNSGFAGYRRSPGSTTLAGQCDRRSARSRNAADLAESSSQSGSGSSLRSLHRFGPHRCSSGDDQPDQGNG